MPEYMLTTTDNPFNPFTQFDEWLSFDNLMGYYTCGYLARITITSDALSDEDQSLAIEDAMDEIIQYDPAHRYLKVERTSLIAGATGVEQKV